MKDSIPKELQEIEKQHSVKIIYAVESGSRAWGFASPDSDFDVRFIYKNDLNYYLSLWEKSDTIEFVTDKKLDGSGWDLRKTLHLLSKSNASLLEWLYSPIIYFERPQLIETLRSFAQKCFSAIACMHHYVSMSKNFAELCQQENVKLKSYLYALRTALAGKWIAEQNSFPPVELDKLLCIAPNEVQDKIREIMEVKAFQNESYLHPKEPLITHFLTKTLTENIEKTKKLSVGKKIHRDLNDFFIECVLKM